MARGGRDRGLAPSQAVQGARPLDAPRARPPILDRLLESLTSSLPELSLKLFNPETADVLRHAAHRCELHEAAEETAEGRFLVTAEARISSERTAGLLRTVLEDEFPNLLGDSSEGGLDPNAISFDAVFQGGAIPIGAKEADCEDRLLECLGVSLRPVEDT